MNLIFVNPWRGVIGPNVAVPPWVAEAAARGHEVHVIEQTAREGRRPVDVRP